MTAASAFDMNLGMRTEDHKQQSQYSLHENVKAIHAKPRKPKGL